jgi:hypothetical protein
MIPRFLYRFVPVLLIVALGGCRGETSRPERSIGDRSSAEQPSAPADVVKRYYSAIESGDYATAYSLWEGAGKASGQTLAQFEHGFAQTERTTATISDSVRVEGAAGSQYATVPVMVEAITREGKRQHFAGTYTVRRAMADGATPEQRTWHIYSAHLAAR